MWYLSGVNLRPATMADARFLYELRMDPLTRVNSVRPGIIPWEEYREEIADKIANELVLIAEVDGAPAGTVRVDLDNFMTWLVHADFRGNGVGKQMVQMAAKPGHMALVKRTNIASRKIAEAAGFALLEDGEMQTWIRSRSIRAPDSGPAGR